MAVAEVVLPRTRGIPNTDVGALRRAARRTTLVRVLMALLLLAALATAVFVARRADTRHAPLLPRGSTGMVVLDASASIDVRGFRRVEAALQKLARDEDRAGLVMFSDIAYELLPPGTPGRELERFLRLFRPVGGQVPANPWTGEFRAGTRISIGLQTAHAALLRDGVEKGVVLLVSDLDAPSTDVQRLGFAIDQMRRDGIELRVIPLFPIAEKEALFEQLIGTGRLLKAPEPTAGVQPPEGAGLQAAAPWLFVLIAVAVAILLALNEGLLARFKP